MLLHLSTLIDAIGKSFRILESKVKKKLLTLIALHQLHLK